MLNQDGYHDEDPLRPARGIANGMMIAIPVWAIVTALLAYWFWPA
jgi:hypothetical protein